MSPFLNVAFLADGCAGRWDGVEMQIEKETAFAINPKHGLSCVDQCVPPPAHSIASISLLRPIRFPCL